MSESTNGGTHDREPYEDEEDLDGFVLYDPTAHEPIPDLEPEPGGPSAAAVVIVVVLAAVVLGGYQLFFAGGAGNSPEPAEAPTLVPSGIATVEAALIPLGGEVQQAAAGTDVIVEVRARASAGAPVTDSVVQFGVESGSAELISDASPTDSVGVARAILRLNEEVERNVIVARLTGSELEARFIVDGVPGPPTRLIRTAGDAQEAEVAELLPVRPSVRVTDALGNPVPRTEVLFSVTAGAGMAAPGRMLTDSLGEASVMWRLGMEIGTQELQATLRSTGSSVAFQANALGRPAAIEGAPRVLERAPLTVTPKRFVIGGSAVCTLEGGVVSCRGANDRGQTGANGTSDLVALSAGVSHVCGLDDTGRAVCWGANEGGQLGDGSRTDRTSPVPVRTDVRMGSLTAGSAHTCGIAGGGIAVCWGSNLSGQLGDGSRTDARFPRAVGGGILFRTLVAGWNHTCGLTANGNAFCWGPNSEGQLGDGTTIDRLTPTLVRGSMESLAAGSSHTCGTSNGGVLCWGDNRFGQVGDGTNQGRSQPERVQGLPSRVTQIAAGAVHTCALAQDGSAYCWGQNLRGQLGIGSTENRNAATPVEGGLRFQSIHAGGALTCGVTANGDQYCWGLNQDGQLGDGTRENRLVPVLVGA